ncbi:MAG: type II secretion system F family protein [Actinoplanes sp.]
MTASLFLALAAAGCISSVSLAAVGVLLPPTRREQMLRTLAAFSTGHVSRARVVVQPKPPPMIAVQRFADVLASGSRKRLSLQLDYAGNPSEWPLDRVIRMRVVTAAVIGLGGWGFVQVISNGHGLIGLPVGAILGLFLPDLLVYNLGTKRQAEIRQSMPDVLDGLVIGVEAGLGLDSAMAQVAVMLNGPMPDEFHRVLQEMKLGVSRTVALRALAARTTVRELKSLVTALVQAGEMGISVAGILREHSQDQRLRRRQRAEEQAQKVAVKLLFPVLFCLFPAIFVVVIGPAALKLVAVFGN